MAGSVSRLKVVKHVFGALSVFFLTVICLGASTVLSAQTDRHYKRLAKWRDTSLPDTLRLQAADHLIRKSYWSAQPDSARLLIVAQRKLASEIANSYWVARSLQNLGSLQLRLADYEEAILNLRQAQRLYEQQGDWYRAGQTMQSLGNTLRKQGRVTEAFEALLASLGYHEKAGDRGRSGRAGSLNSLGNLYLNQQDFEQAAENYEASLALHQLIGKESGIAANLNNLSKVYTQWGQYDAARKYLDQSLLIKQGRNDLEGIANTYKNYGDIFLQWGQLDSAKLYYHRTLALQDSLGLRGDAASSLADLGVVALAREDWATARDYCSRGWEQATTLGDLKVQVKNGDCLSMAYRQLKQPVEALDILEKTYALRDSFLSAGNTRELEDIRRKYEEEAAELINANQGPRSWWKLGILLGLVGLVLSFLWRRVASSFESVAVKGVPVSEHENREDKSSQAYTGSSSGSPELLGNLPSGPFPIAPALEGEREELSWKQQVQLLIQEELQQRREITTSSLAKQLTTSERQLLRKCREEADMTTKQLIQLTRLDYAKDLIDAKEVGTVAELSQAVGFKSSSYFSQQFSARFGTRPSKLL